MFLFLRITHSLLGLTVLLCFDHSTNHGDRHGDADDEHRRRLSQTQATVLGCQGAAGQLGGSAAGDVLVVGHSQVSNPVDLPEDALQVTVTGPGVGGHLEVCGGGLEHQEGLELDVLQLVCLEAEPSQTPERSQSFSLDHRDVVVAEQQNLQALLSAQQAFFQHIQPVPFQVEEAQARQAAQSPDIHRPDAVVAEVQLPQVLEVSQRSGVQVLQQVPVQPELLEGGQTLREVLREPTQPVKAQVQPLQELQRGQRLDSTGKSLSSRSEITKEL